MSVEKEINITGKKNACLEKLTEVFDNNADNEFIIEKIYNHVLGLDLFIVNLKRQIEERAIRKEELTKQKEIFTKNFLFNNQFFYNPSNNKYFYYDGTNYSNETEDDVHFKCVTGITNHHNLNDWKQKTRISVLKEIKNKSIFKTIPDTNTIQNIHSKLTPLFFKTKTETKFFLTIIGDNILKKGSDLIYFINPKCKTFLNELQEQVNVSFGNYNVIDNFKTKYKDHLFSNIRIIDVNNNIENKDLWTTFIKEYILDFICVCIHYSNRYNTSEEFLFKEARQNFRKNILFLKTTNQDMLIDMFIKDFLIIDKSIKSEIDWKNMHFLWKKFIENLNIPNVIYTNILKQKLLLKLETDNDSFIGLTSKYLPNIEEFLCFWNENMVYEVKENFIGDFEISEVLLLYNDYRISKNIGFSDIEDEFIVQIIYHFMDNIEIKKDKYLLNVYSKLWNKENDVYLSIGEYLTKSTTSDVYGAYEYYIEQSHGKKFIVSKCFFEKCFSNYFNDN
jgi:hypothetical protein